MTEFKKYDSDVDMECRNVRLTKDAQKLGDNFVKVTFCLTSRNEKDEDMWMDAIPLDSGAEKAALLKKGDMLSVSGFPTMQKWGDDKVSHTLKYARMHYPMGLLIELKARGEGSTKAKPAPKGKKTVPVKKPKEIIDLDDDDAGDDV